MNSSDVPSTNGILQDEIQDERAASSSIPNSDTNANVNDGIDRSKGAIPKIKSAPKPISASQRKSVKFNNNLDEMHTLNGVNAGALKRNGFDKEHRERQSAVEDKINCISNSDPFDEQSSEVEYDLPLNFHTLCLKKPETKVDDSEDSSDDTELLSISDDGCIYTYKGDNAADLPESFFSLDIPVIQNQNAANDAQQRNSSPEMDFLEMDFDPGPSGDIDSDSDGDNPRVTSTARILEKPEEEEEEHPVNGAGCLRNAHQPCENKVQNKLSSVACKGDGKSEENLQCQEAQLRAVEDVKMPWSCVLSQRTTGPSCTRFVRRQHNSSGELVSPVDPVSPTGEAGAFGGNSQPEKVVSEELGNVPSPGSVKRAMIWSEEEAANLQVVQIGASACGATAVLNVLKALRFPLPTKERLQDAVQTRLRANASPFVDYLLSRSAAGTTHEDLIEGLEKLSDGRIYARFFPMHPERVVNLNMWLSFWIENGAVPIATLNLQRGVQPVPDAWHHQMVYGVGEEGVYLTNPLECVRAEDLWPQLCSDSVLLVRREDVLSRWNREEFVRLMKLRDGRWRRLNVVGQTARMVLESWREQKPSFSRMTHICIPAEYSAGITLAIEIDSPAFALLSECPDLPLLEVNS